MKKGGISVLLVVTLVACGLIIGIAAGRSMNSGDVSIQFATESISDGFDTQSSKDDGPAFLINVNTASADLLDSLPGIGPVIAQRIVDYRKQNGPFTSKMDLINVEGLGKAKLLDIYELITVEDSYEDTRSG